MWRGTFFKLLRRLNAPFARMSAGARRDLALIGASALVLYLFAVSVDLFDLLIEWHEAQEKYELDEIFLAVIVVSFGLIAFSMRRMGEATRELQLRLVAEEQTKTMAVHDALTGLPNRRKLNHELSYQLGRAKVGEMVVVAAVDLDRFKPVNDLYGHATGDAVLIALAGLMVGEVAQDGMVARIGGDEFVVIWSNLANRDEILSKVTKLSHLLEAPLSIGSNQIAVGASIGVAVLINEDVTAEEVLRRADIALFRAKEDGRGRFAFFDHTMDERVQARLDIERQLRDAMARDAIEPFFQPLVHLSDNSVYGYEVLARLRREDGSIMGPDAFIPLAEEVGVIGDLTYALLRRACTETRDWPSAPLLSLNISPVQLRDSALPQKLLQVLLETGYPAARLQVEITETALVFDLEQARRILMSLRNQGVLIALDDFGTGYSSLRHLRELPFDNLKIDRSFVQAMDEDSESATIVHTILDLARNLGIAVTAEGVETELSAAHLKELGCANGQGYLFGAPVAAENIRREFQTPAAVGATKVA